MTRNNKLLLVLLAFIVSITIGYAVFSQTITVTGTATASGDFKFLLTPYDGIAQDIKTNNLYEVYNFVEERALDINFNEEKGNVQGNISVSNNTASFTANLKQPGDLKYYTIKLTNTGSIPIKVDLYDGLVLNSTYSGEIYMSNGVTLPADLSYILSCTQGVNCGVNITGGFYSKMKTLFKGLVSFDYAFVKESIYTQVMEDMETEDKPCVILNTNEELYMVFSSSWLESQLTSEIKGLNVTSATTVTIPLSQITSN